ncbi:related to Cell division control protein 3 [Saccharomycodes ludwigii]|uniref:Related to Cell division control protein 3 n=1 Tax=Saccharomycodes ludwigii TaxID=36035 RepID=A0A376B2R5_9ASCO|nr:hypothetical protein SCDLUD_001562 [Saccharomycodes ludwigii]KAH3901783.1 hypothetical protein SCDLUD_001562 [Saccharomycodes ludwigii]SSD58973.1 related to Cell division control protein 3 [Saccharomycodes ludwigii]
MSVEVKKEVPSENQLLRETKTNNSDVSHLVNNGNSDVLTNTENAINIEGQVIPPQPELKIIRRKINGYVGFANLPKQWHRKSIRRGFCLNLLCVGQRGLGKSTLINTLFNKRLYDDVNDPFSEIELEKDIARKLQNISIDDDPNGVVNTNDNKVAIKALSTEIEENGVKLKLTVIDTPGFGDSIDNSDSWKPIVKEIDSRFDQYLDAENRINRTPLGSREDPRVHACLYFIEPTVHGLRSLDIEFCTQVYSKCNLIPIIAKSDILTDEEIEHFKKIIMIQLNEAGVELFQPPIYEKSDDIETVNSTKNLIDKYPFAVTASIDLVQALDGRVVRGRAYPWGCIEIDNASHSDFIYLSDLLIRQYMEELREKTNNVLYENYRSNKLFALGIKQDNSVFREYDPATRSIEERKLHEAKLAKLESEMKSVFQQKVSEKEKKLQKSEAELFARHKEMKEKLTKQLKALEEKKNQLEHSMVNAASVSASSQPTKKKGFLR